ncbi:alpha/beta hydrolase [Herbiconiux liukaitaii]|uniref:alpha/beta hydrolase n=1 Tax=Herbiconiux liukaitaii TaxID=3342799 RepID=UPI0035B8F68B
MDLIFVHGALVRDGDWWWGPTAELLLERTGLRSRALGLPSCGETTAPGNAEEQAEGLAADAAALRAALDEVESAVVVGHSYGGTVIAEAGAHASVTHLLYISSYLPDVGLSQGAIMSGETDPVALADAGHGTLGLAGFDASSFGARFLQDGDERMQEEAWHRVTGQAAAAFMTPTTQAGWEGVDSTYLVCGQDRSTSVELQRRHAARATRAVELDTGHHPFLTRPDLVAEQVIQLIA